VKLDGKPKLLAKHLADPALMALEPGLEQRADANERAYDMAMEARYY
jgi:hypothetical protein